MDRRLLVVRRNSDGRVLGRCGCTTDQKGCFHPEPLHLFGYVGHLVQTRGDQPRESDHIDTVLDGCLKDLLAGAHDP